MNVFIGCSSKDNLNDDYYNLAMEVSNTLSKKYDLIYGGFDKGMMGICANTFLKNQKKVIGVTVKAYVNKEFGKLLNQYLIFESTFERIKYLYDNADLCVILPGGIGSLTELMSFVEEKRTSLTNKKIVLYNYNNYYDKLLSYIEYQNNLKFNESDILDNIIIIKSMNELEGLI